jgi:pimeloyl-ACP methyl ester carboxylesterase
VVLVSGIDGTGQMFFRQVPRLARSYRVATYALRDSASSMDVMINDLSRVIEAASPENRRSVVVGESFGGALALSFALARPEQVEALVIVNSFSRVPSPLRLRLAILGLSALPWAAMKPLRRVAAGRLHSPGTPSDDIKRYVELTSRATRRGYLNRLRALSTYDVRDRLGDINVPTLFLAADRDRLLPSAAEARYMAARAPRAAARILERHGHTCLIAPGVDLALLLDEWLSDAMKPT